MGHGNLLKETQVEDEIKKKEVTQMQFKTNTTSTKQSSCSCNIWTQVTETKSHFQCPVPNSDSNLTSQQKVCHCQTDKNKCLVKVRENESSYV